MSAFESVRGGFTHRYDVRPDALHYTSGATKITVAWRNLEKFAPGRKLSLYVLRRDGQPLGVWLDPDKMKAFLTEAVAAWGTHDRDTALKAAFEYGLNERSMGWVWLVLSIFFPAFLSAMLLVDGYHIDTCMPLLRDPSAKSAIAQVLKVKKDRRGEMVWTLQFQTDAGHTVHGLRTSYAGMDEKGRPIGEPRVVYSPSRPSCWDLASHPLIDQTSSQNEKISISRKELQFNTAMAWGFGALFAVLGVLGVIWSTMKICRRHPFHETVLAAAKTLASAKG